MSIESQADLDGIMQVGRVVAEALRAMERETRSGITTSALDEIGAGVPVHVVAERLGHKKVDITLNI